ncbi:Dolichyl-diphosphooligosaccharide--protein glycosyltransferase subunit 1A [Acorus gramineus]|uniref:Dolichyl-diphosphooligosaccharide--protein glycosyltransferase subunit 1 n=1 Tax=Acorus gramineus TaxID=55184 RepID=A0AAV8ZW15_ACOGR|nr:Dolichyl-diphosphooligosaccharide--protein glycosyltransferase subunit 1A [Acorus gramineus]KAK1262683.1 Dolichyl-diphosphooligosaccharide--protein glycosyltransferase subunit 1A [Acorus gramineus]
MAFRFHLLLLLFAIVSASVQAELTLSKVDRKIDLSSHIVRVTSTLKVENLGPGVASEVLLAVPDYQANNLADLRAVINEGKSSIVLHIEHFSPEVSRPEFTFYSISLTKGLEKGQSVTLDVFSAFTHSVIPFPEEITQADSQLILYKDSAYFVSPHAVKVQTLRIKLPSARVEAYTNIQNTKFNGTSIRYGPYENLPPFSSLPITVHFENNRPFAVAKQLVREIEISHWGNVQVTEHYRLFHGGALNKGGFSRINYQSRQVIGGISSFRSLLARLPPRAHSVYYRDEIGNISTSHLWGDSRKTELEIEPRYPMFGGWRTSFTIGYGLPLHDFLFESEGKHLLDITFGCPMDEVVIDELFVKVVLPEGSKDISASTPFPTKQWQEVKFSHLDIVGRPVVVLQKTNVVPEHNLHFQVHYRFNNLSLLMEPMMLISGFFFLFVSCIVYMRVDMSISKTSASYQAKLQWEEMQATVQQARSIINRCLAIHDKLDASLRDLSRTGDVQQCKSTRKAADGMLKELSKELKPLLGVLQSSPQASQIWPKVEELAVKEREMQERLMLKHSTVVDSFEKKSGGRDIENRIASHQQKISALRHEIDDLLDAIDEI